MFTSNSNSGFAIEFANKWKISVQFGPHNYCERQGSKDNPMQSSTFKIIHSDFVSTNHRNWHSKDAEIAVIDSKGNFVPIPTDHELFYKWAWNKKYINSSKLDDVCPHASVEYFEELLTWVRLQDRINEDD